MKAWIPLTEGWVNMAHVASVGRRPDGSLLLNIAGSEQDIPCSGEAARQVQAYLAEWQFEATPTPAQAEPPGADSGQRAAQDATVRGEYDEDEALRRFDDESERENPSTEAADIELNKEGPI
jgi:hypothetical protein